MAHRKYDGVQQLATGTGVGALTLGAATSSKYRTFSGAGAADGDTGYFRIQHSTIDAEWEVVKGTLSSGTLVRTFDSKSSSSTGALISFSAGNKIVSHGRRGARHPGRGSERRRSRHSRLHGRPERHGGGPT